uniref:C-type lectin domain-containing protein n=1 Tax=Rhabditophanes sp. KR3021 TaxID=114890 RepID=A0AC35U6N9_9BILA
MKSRCQTLLLALIAFHSITVCYSRNTKVYKPDGNVRLQTSLLLMANKWHYNSGFWYKYFEIEMYWEEASNFCKQFDGDLTSIGSQQENDFIDKMRKRNDIWIGFTKPLYGFYEWSDLTPTSYMNWGPTQPNEPNVNCAIMSYTIEDSGKWHDYSCDTKMPQYFVCKTKI